MWWLFVLGFVLGGVFGVFAMSLVTAARAPEQDRMVLIAEGQMTSFSTKPVARRCQYCGGMFGDKLLMYHIASQHQDKLKEATQEEE